jgi:hypothetical protein
LRYRLVWICETVGSRLALWPGTWALAPVAITTLRASQESCAVVTRYPSASGATSVTEVQLWTGASNERA